MVCRIELVLLIGRQRQSLFVKIICRLKARNADSYSDRTLLLKCIGTRDVSNP